jgi:hypothetical protein
VKRAECPFWGEPCIKETRLNGHRLGVCSVVVGKEYVVTCPKRYGKDILREIAYNNFKPNTNVLVFKEVEIVKVGNSGLKSDYLLVDKNNFENFVAVEIVTVDTTNTGELVRAFRDAIQKGYYARKYNFGINWANVVKRTLPQLVKKGAQLASWNKRIYVVLQKSLLNHLREWSPFTSSEGNIIIFLVYDFIEEGKLGLVKTLSAKAEDLAKGLAEVETDQDLHRFIRKLQASQPCDHYCI